MWDIFGELYLNTTAKYLGKVDGMTREDFLVHIPGLAILPANQFGVGGFSRVEESKRIGSRKLATA